VEGHKHVSYARVGVHQGKAEGRRNRRDLAEVTSAIGEGNSKYASHSFYQGEWKDGKRQDKGKVTVAKCLRESPSHDHHHHRHI